MPDPSFVCSGKHCRKQPGHDELIAALRPVSDVHEVRCQKVCSGPVVGIEVDGRLEWFAKVRKPKARAAVRKLVREGGPVKKRLAKRRVAKRAGLLRT